MVGVVIGESSMVIDLEGKDISLWVGTTKQTNYPEFSGGEATFDAAVVGGGITGIIAAYQLQQTGLRVVLLEKSRIVEWTTGGTTAKLTSQHYLIYDYLIKRHGQPAAAAFAMANQNGIDEIENLSKELGIECDFSRRSAYVFTGRDDKVNDIKSEVASAASLGLSASFETEVGLPFEVKGAIKFSNQAQFHPRKFLLGLAAYFVSAGGVIYEHTKAVDILPGSPNVIKTKQGDLYAKFIVQASGEPFWGGDILQGKMWSKMSYALAVELNDESSYPRDMYITTDTPMRTIRTADYDGGRVMIFGGESHEYSEATYDPDSRYRALTKDVHERFDVNKVLYRWLAGDYMPYDRMPYIGPHPGYPSIFIATGYRAWGLAWAMSAARIITGYVTGRPLSWAPPFGLERAKDSVLASDKTNLL